MPKDTVPSASLITVGVKILVGVSLASNLFIGTLLYVNIHSSNTVEKKVNEVLAIREQLSSNLRSAIVALQDEFLSLPNFLKIDPRTKVTEAIQQTFKAADSRRLEGRSAYTELYSRNERKNLTKNQYVVQILDGNLILSSGVPAQDGSFSETVDRLTLKSANPTEDAIRLKDLINTLSAKANSPDAIVQRVKELSAIIADSSLEAETTRNEILQHVETIRAKESDLQALRKQQRKFTLGIGGIAILTNMIVLFILVRFIVEKPLRKLTWTIEEIRSGKSPEIPYQKRKDQIGILSGAITNFREALFEIQNENTRKVHEKVIIEEMFDVITTVVHSLEIRARELVKAADILQDLSTSTENQSASVTSRAAETALHTSSVSESTNQLQSAFQEIQAQIQDQNGIVRQILDSNNHSRTFISALNESIGSIHTIIGAVSEITNQTKLLALNATIEAARAGSAGRGFGVVATEIKELSHKTEEATDDVMGKIRAIEEASSILFVHLDKIDDRMQSLNKHTVNITSSVTAQQQVTDLIANLASQTSENTQTVSTSILEVSNAAAKTRDLAGQVHNFSSEISVQLTGLLQDTTDRLEKLAHFGSSHNLSQLKN